MNGRTIIPECYVDTCLTETITAYHNQFNHQKGCGTVSRVMQNKFSDTFAVGIIDKDKRELPYIKEFDLIASNGSLFLYKHKGKHHYIIQISPAIEQFFLKAAAEKEIDITTYGLPSDLKHLTRITKQISTKNEAAFNTFKRLFRDISDTSEFQRLAALIQYLGNNTYAVNIENLREIING
ncbi:hypothetical protein EZS27_014251 [termite gut metagenome]|uniref:Uncharacterized protein n=1 Tax=termite gut metagenome TaxID=433724 RepID=A0A5J4RVF1_9ZZZZ